MYFRSSLSCRLGHFCRKCLQPALNAIRPSFSTRRLHTLSAWPLPTVADQSKYLQRELAAHEVIVVRCPCERGVESAAAHSAEDDMLLYDSFLAELFS